MNLRKYLPLILVGAGILIVALVGFFIFRASKTSQSPTTEEANVPDLPESQWPVVSLTPTNNPDVKGSDGHWLNFQVQNINVPGAATMDYELVYSTTSGGQQGVPGTVKLEGKDVQRNLLLGSESSGKFRYDEGVEIGTITIKFRDSKGKLMGKLSTEFHLQSGVTELTSADGKFSYTLDNAAKGVFFVTMKTFAQADSSMVVAWQNGYGVFASDGKPHSGAVK